MRSDRINNLIAFLIGCALVVGAYWLGSRISHNASNQRDTCQQVQTVVGAIQTIINQDLHSLGMPGSGGYAYYLQHPDELAKTRAVLQYDVATFEPKKC